MAFVCCVCITCRMLWAKCWPVIGWLISARSCDLYHSLGGKIAQIVIWALLAVYR